MRISFNWLKDLINLPSKITVNDVADKLTMGGFEVEEINNTSISLRDIIIVRINEVSDFLNRRYSKLYVVYDGTKNINVISKDYNLKHGDFVAFAGVGYKLPNGVIVNKNIIEGVLSSGVFLSEKELGFSLHNKNVFVLNSIMSNDKIIVGDKLLKALKIDDVFITLNITPNRSDALSHIGIARELAALFNIPINFGVLNSVISNKNVKHRVNLKIRNTESCSRYAFKIIENVKIKESPTWLKARLLACGIRPINNVVDITNFVMLESGQPLHAFDLDKIKETKSSINIEVRNSYKDEKLNKVIGSK